MAKKLVYGVGLNNADYAVTAKVNGRRVNCPFYAKWSHMLMRCYSEKCQDIQPTYIGCTVCNEWLAFSNFKAWMQQQDWKGKELDKDLLVKGSKVYSPETCVFVDKATNLFANECGAIRGDWPVGVCFYKRYDKFRVHCCNPFTKKIEHLGYFTCPEQAHLAWKRRKHELACQLAGLQTDQRAACALRARYL